MAATATSGNRGPGLYRASIAVPYRSDKRYLIAVSGPSGAAYALGLDAAGLQASALGGAPASPSANGSEAKATKIKYSETLAARLGAIPASS